jgi:glutamate synthase (NADPH/NADH) small chain
MSVEDHRGEVGFEDYKPSLTPAQAVAEANRCLYCEDAPCMHACPTHIDIPRFIRKIATGNLQGSARTIFSSNILGMSCARVCPVEVLCEGDCVYHHIEAPPINIGRLQRYATDAAYEQGWRFFEAGPDTGKSVGLIGAGPASLACAHQLRRAGHACTIYEAKDFLGGLNTSGVAPYKMKADRSLEEIQWVLEIGGVDIKTGVQVGRDVTWEQLEQEHDALFLGVGLGPDRWLPGLPVDFEGLRGAVDFIEEMKLGQLDLGGVQSVLVVGGGNTALDVVREALGLGVPQVTMVYRGDQAHMSGYQHEWDIAKKSGAQASWRSQPLEVLSEEGRVTGLRCQRMDAARKPIEGETFVLEAERIYLAIGQSRLGELVQGVQGVTLDWGRVVVDEEGYTGHPGLYAGGDCANGGKEVVNAVAEGQRAALAMDRYLRGEENG